MKRALLATLVVAFVVVLGAIPYWFGVEAERIYQHQISSLSSNNKIEIRENRFERGWLRSHAESKVEVSGTPIVVFAEHTIEHGPIPVSDPLKYIASLKPLQALIKSRLAVQKAAQPGQDLAIGTLLTRVNIDGTTRSQINVPAESIQFDPAGTLTWEQVTGHIEFDPAESSWRGSVNLTSADWKESGAAIGIGSSVFNFLTYPGSRGLVLGNSSLTAETLEGYLPQSREKFVARNLTLDSTASEQGNKVSYSLGGKMEDADFVDLKIDSGDWTIMVEGLDLESLTKLNDMEVGAAIPLNDLMTLVSKHQARFESSLQFLTHSGPFTASAKMSLPNSNGSTNPLVLLSALVGSLDLDMPDAVVEIIARSVLHADLSKAETSPSAQPSQGKIGDAAVSDKIQSWVNSNILTRQGSRYRFRATIDKGAIQLNGKPFNLMSLLR